MKNHWGALLSAYHPLYHVHHLLALLFLLGITVSSQLFYSGFIEYNAIILAAVLSGYLALNIGANDAGNHIGPLVGSSVIGIAGAILLAAPFEMAGALLAGNEVISTIKDGIIDQQQISNTQEVIKIMLSAVFASAIWLNIATISRTPVSTTHAIVGGVLGAGISIGGSLVINWKMLSTIMISWLVSPLLGSAIAALLLYLIKRNITYQEEMSKAAEKVVPLLVSMMAWIFTTYLLNKGLKISWRVDLTTALLCGMSVGAGVFLIIKPIITQRTALLPNTKSAINRHFNLPLLLGAGLLSFAHGSNDVANAIGPLIAVKETLSPVHHFAQSGLPTWLMLIGAMGIPLGLILYGRRLISTLGNEITELDQVRAFCIVTSVTITVLIASQFGIPVSSTHTAVGAIFGIGFLRESLKTNYAVTLEIIRRHKASQSKDEISAFIEHFDKSSFSEKGELLKQLNCTNREMAISKKERKLLNKLYRNELVTRSTFKRIIIAWFITLPATALLASLTYAILDW
ncbi:MAG: inorganic phosphate transporter [Candidatus Thiodiazotropha sp.]